MSKKSEPSIAELADMARAGDSEVRTVNEETGGEKGIKLFRYDLIPSDPLKELALLYGLGAYKYADRNWERGYDFSKSFGALQRHAWQWWEREDTDPEMNVSHMTNVAWHAFALSELIRTHPELDDRP